MFEKLIRRKIRFPYKGLCQAEDVYDLTREQLDALHKSMVAAQQPSEGGLIERRKTKEVEDMALRLAFVKHVFNVKTAEALARGKEKELADLKQRVLKVKQERKDGKIDTMTDAELDAIIAL